jgi:transposase
METVSDGQHRHSAKPNECTLNVAEDALKIMAEHLKGSCPGSWTMKTDIPVNFLMDNGDETTATIICGLCKKPVGKCQIEMPR